MNGCAVWNGGSRSVGDSVLREKSKQFAKKTIFLCRRLKERRVESELIRQLLRCGTSVGANIHEAQYAQGRKDFVSKLEIALKECNECDYWLELLLDTGCISPEEHRSMQTDCIEMRRMMVASATTVKKKYSVSDRCSF